VQIISFPAVHRKAGAHFPAHWIFDKKGKEIKWGPCGSACGRRWAFGAFAA
jgi:hypothetical protein